MEYRLHQYNQWFIREPVTRNITAFFVPEEIDGLTPVVARQHFKTDTLDKDNQLHVREGNGWVWMQLHEGRREWDELIGKGYIPTKLFPEPEGDVTQVPMQEAMSVYIDRFIKHTRPTPIKSKKQSKIRYGAKIIDKPKPEDLTSEQVWVPADKENGRPYGWVNKMKPRPNRTVELDEVPKLEE